MRRARYKSQGPPPQDRHGFSAVIILLFIVATCLVMVSYALAMRAMFLASETSDQIRQVSIDRRVAEQIVNEALLGKLELAPTKTSAGVDVVIDSLLAQKNAAGQGVSIARSSTAPALPLHRYYPDVARPTIQTASSPGYATVLTSVDFQAAALMADGVAEVTTAGSPLSWTFTRAGLTAAENRVITVAARVWSIPISNWSFIAYGLPATFGGAGIPRKSPTNTETVLASPSFNGRALLVTTLRPNPPYSDGDPTAFGMLYSAPGPGQAETLPRYYRPLVSAAWNAWEYIWGSAYQTELLNAAGSNVYDCDAFTQAVLPGVSASGSVVSVDAAQVTGGCLVIVDGLGGRTVNFSGGAGAAPLVLVIKNSTGTPTTLNISGTNTRTTLVYARDTAVVLQAGATFNGGVFLDPYSSISGSGTIQGVLAFHGVNSFPATGITVTSAPSPAVKADLDSICPRMVLVTTSSTIN